MRLAVNVTFVGNAAFQPLVDVAGIVNSWVAEVGEKTAALTVLYSACVRRRACGAASAPSQQGVLGSRLRLAERTRCVGFSWLIVK